MGIADIGLRHLSAALSGEMKKATVDQWIDDAGQKVVIYWKPLTGKEQKQIDEFSTNVDRVCMTVKIRARDERGRLVFADTPLESLTHDFDFEVLQAIAFLMLTGMGQNAIEDQIEAVGKE